MWRVGSRVEHAGMETGYERSFGDDTCAGAPGSAAPHPRHARNEPEPLVDAIARELRRLAGPGRREWADGGSLRRSRSRARRLLHEAFARGSL
jgi:hypothetical protein